MNFDKYFRPNSVLECIKLLQEHGNTAKIVAGGTDLVVRMRSGAFRPSVIIDIKKIPELNGINVKEDCVEIGACTDLMTISKADELIAKWPIVKAGAGHVSSTQIRNNATLGGNSCNASPSADTVPCLIISEAVVNIVGPNGERQIPIDEFFVGPGKTVLLADEIVKSFTIPGAEDTSGAAYYKHAIRGDTDISIIGLGARIVLDENGVVTKARIAAAAVAPTPLRIKAAEEYLVGKKLNDDVIEQAGQIARDNVSPISDQRGSKEYRKEMIYVATKNMIREAALAAK